MQSRLVRITALTLWVGLLVGFTSSTALAQYKQTNLTSNQAGKAKHQDSLLQNAWGLVYAPGSPFWVSDEWNGWSTLYDGAGVPQSLQVIIPPASGSGPGMPTGIVYNTSTTDFAIQNWPSVFLFATLDGTIQGWSTFDPSTALIAVNNSANKASYNGLAVTSKKQGNFLYAADLFNNKIDMYDNTFKFVKSFTDSTIPKGFSTFNVQDINGLLYVAYASPTGGTGGFIDIFKENGTFVKRLAHGAPLNQPWGFAVAPNNFGPLSNTLLISNNTNTGTINAFNLKTGKFVGTIKNSAGKPIKIDQLWGIDFGGGTTSNGKKNELYFTAGPNNNVNGLFGKIAFK
jgi:uncharacterized protein (TIGR03118 family)